MFASSLRRAVLALACGTLVLPIAAQAQGTTSPPPLDFSGVIFANFSSGGAKNARANNAFNLERAYLTFKMPAGDNLSIRVTGDVFQTANASWVLRAKYAYVQYNWLRGDANSLTANVRFGLLHTVAIDHEEGYWVRYISKTAVENSGFFASSDAGVAGTFTLPNHVGEVYATITNGSGYTSGETDRFKDYGARLTLMPLHGMDGLLKSLDISPWYIKGAAASGFAANGSALQKDRYGVLAALKDPRITLGLSYGRRSDEADGATPAAPTTTVDGQVISAYTIAKPMALMGNTTSPWAVVLRYDDFKPNTANDPHQTFMIGGIAYQLSSKTMVSLDYQDGEPKSGGTGADTRTLFFHVMANF
jgi:hypothetical protein